MDPDMDAEIHTVFDRDMASENRVVGDVAVVADD